MIEVTVDWERTNGTFSSHVTGTTDPVSVVVRDDEGIVYGNDASDPEDETCDACDGNGWFVIAHDGDVEHDWIERCDDCTLFDSDDEAAIAASLKLQQPVAWARFDHGDDMESHPQPYLYGQNDLQRS